jgi:hypothetical protein
MENQTYIGPDVETVDASNVNPAEDYVRALGPLERLFWLLDQASSAHFSLVAEVEGTSAVADWRAAIDHVQRRHPFLSVCIDTDEGSDPYFRHIPDKRIPIRVVYADASQPQWLAELERELGTPFDPASAPLVRAVLLHEPDRAALILTGHHSIADALSLSFVIRDILLELSGTRLEPLGATPSVESLVDSIEVDGPAGQAKETVRVPPSVAHLRRGIRPHVRALALTAGLTARLRERARQEKTTVHGALSAAVAIAGTKAVADWKENGVRILSPVDVRKVVGAGESCGVFFGGVGVLLRAGAQTDFWELARAARNGVADAQTAAGAKEFFAGLRQAVSPELNPETAWKVAEHGFAHDVLLSNLGDLRYGTSFGRFKLEAMWGPPVIGGMEGGITVGVATANGSLRLLQGSHAPAPFVLEEMERALTAACR